MHGKLRSKLEVPAGIEEGQQREREDFRIGPVVTLSEDRRKDVHEQLLTPADKRRLRLIALFE